MTIRAFHFPFHLFSFFIDFSVLGHSNVEHALIESRLQVRLLQSECEYVAPKLSFGEKQDVQQSGKPMNRGVLYVRIVFQDGR